MHDHCDYIRGHVLKPESRLSTFRNKVKAVAEGHVEEEYGLSNLDLSSSKFIAIIAKCMEDKSYIFPGDLAVHCYSHWRALSLI